jgi:hypothetical protein
MDPINVRELVRIISETGCSVVISSAWRVGEWTADGLSKSGDIRRCLIQAGGGAVVDAVIGVTPDLLSSEGGTVTRGDEIAAWLTDHPEVESFVILDDLGADRPVELREEIGSSLANRLVLTDVFRLGLNEERADEAIRLLKDPQAIANNSPMLPQPLTIAGKEQPTDDMIIIHFSNGEHEIFSCEDGIMGVQHGEDWMEFFLGDGTNQRWELSESKFTRVS